MQTRRVITGHNAEGRSMVVYDGPLGTIVRRADGKSQADVSGVWKSGPLPTTRYMTPGNSFRA